MMVIESVSSQRKQEKYNHCQAFFLCTHHPLTGFPRHLSKQTYIHLPYICLLQLSLLPSFSTPFLSLFLIYFGWVGFACQLALLSVCILLLLFVTGFHQVAQTSPRLEQSLSSPSGFSVLRFQAYTTKSVYRCLLKQMPCPEDRVPFRGESYHSYVFAWFYRRDPKKTRSSCSHLSVFCLLFQVYGFEHSVSSL